MEAGRGVDSIHRESEGFRTTIKRRGGWVAARVGHEWQSGSLLIAGSMFAGNFPVHLCELGKKGPPPACDGGRRVA